MLHVDLKTIHNWVNQGHLAGARTKGRHLRFERPEIVRFMRAYGYPLPENMGAPQARVLVERALSGAWLKGLQAVANVVVASNLFDCALRLSAGGHELVIISLEKELHAVQQFASAVRAWEPTRCLTLVGVGGDAKVRAAFIGVGGDAALPLEKRSAIKHVCLWLTGASSACPPGIEFRSKSD